MSPPLLIAAFSFSGEDVTALGILLTWCCCGGAATRSSALEAAATTGILLLGSGILLGDDAIADDIVWLEDELNAHV